VSTASSELEVNRSTLKAFDGTELFTLRWTSEAAEQSTGPVVLLVHGYGEHIERYHEMAGAFVVRQLPVWGFDCRGHGQSGGRRGHVHDFEYYLKDLQAVREKVEARWPGRPLVMLGQSHGGLIVARAAQRSEAGLAGVVISAPLMGVAVQVPAWKVLLGKVMSKFWPTLSLPNEINPAHLSRSAEIVEKYAADPLVHRVATARWYTEMLAAQTSALQDAPKMTLPILTLQGDADQIVDPAATRRFAEAVGSKDATFEELAGCYHEVFNEPERHQLYERVMDWLSERFASA